MKHHSRKTRLLPILLALATIFALLLVACTEATPSTDTDAPTETAGEAVESTEAPEETITQLMDVDTLVIGALRQRPHATHQTIDEAIEVARRVRAREVYLIHMNHEAGLHAETEAMLPEHVHLAYDRLTIEIK